MAEKWRKETRNQRISGFAVREIVSPRNGRHEPQNAFPHVACSDLPFSPPWREDSCLSSEAPASPPDFLLIPHVIHLYSDLFSPWVFCYEAEFRLRKCSTFFFAVSPQGSSLVYSVIFKNFIVWPSLPPWQSPRTLLPRLFSKPGTASGFWVHSRYPGQPPSLCLWWFKHWNQLSAQTPGKATCLWCVHHANFRRLRNCLPGYWPQLVSVVWRQSF